MISIFFSRSPFLIHLPIYTPLSTAIMFCKATNNDSEMAPLTRRLSIEEAHSLAGLARRKSNDRMVREDLLRKLGHTNVLDSLLKDIAKRSPPPSPTQACVKLDRKPAATIQWATQVVSKVEQVDEYGYVYEEDGEEDLESLSLCRTPTRPVR